MAANKTQSHILYPELSYEINGLCFDVQNELGPYAKEKQYGDCFERGLQEKSLNYKRELRVGDSGNILDFLVEGKIAIELKSVRTLIAKDYLQIQNYLQATGIELGILVNFRGRYVKPIRILRLSKPAQKKQE